MLRDRKYLWLAGLLILLSLPARFVRVNDSIWLDESWVANSLMEPTLHDLFYPESWTQSAPPLFLLLERGMVAAFGYSEPSLRIFPILACLVGTVFAALALRRWLSTWAALLAFTLLCSNYYLIKYSQQVKQYGTDFLVSALLLFLLGRYLDNKSPRIFAAILAVGAAGIFLSYTAVFWLPTIFIVISLPLSGGEAEPAGKWRFPWPRMAIGAGVLGAAFLLLDLAFIRPNRSQALVDSFEYPQLSRLLWSLHNLLSTLGMTFIGRRGRVADLVAIATVAVGLYSVIWAIGRLRTAGIEDRRSLMLLLCGVLPPLCCLAAGFVRLYPVLDFPRMWLFTLPGAALLLGNTIDIFLAWISRDETRPLAVPAMVAAACILAVVATQFIIIRYPAAAEENRPAMVFLKSHMDSQDLLFVHGWMYSQFLYYRNTLGFHPEHLYVGNESWPCCPKGAVKEVTSPELTDFHSDLLEAARRAKGHNLWMLVPSGLEGTWAAYMRPELEKFPAVLEEGGCHREVSKLFGQTSVESYSCR